MKNGKNRARKKNIKDEKVKQCDVAQKNPKRVQIWQKQRQIPKMCVERLVDQLRRASRAN
jgi:hypothetical protein